MKYFPFFLQLEKLPCLIVGGGSVAERKLDLLIKASADITIVSVDFTDYILEDWESKEEGNIKLNGLTQVEWMGLYLNFLDKKINEN